MTELLPTPDSTIVAKSLTSTVIKVKPSKPIPSEPVQWTPTAAVSSSSVSVHSTKPFSFSNKRSSTIKLGKSTTLAKSGFGKSPAPPTQSSSEPTSAFSTPIIPSGPGIPFPLPQNSTYMTKQQSSASVGYTSEATPSKSRFSFPKRPTSKTTLRKSASSTSVGPSTSASPIIQSSSRYTNTSSTLIRQEGTKFSFPGRPTPITTKLTSKRPSKDASYGSDRPETATETAPYSVVPSVIKCRCKGNPNVDPPCCKAVYKTVTKTEPTTKPIVILVPDPTTIYGEKLTVTKDLWKTLTDRKTFTKEKWGTCKTTVLDYKTQTLCKAPEPTYNAPPHDIGRPDEPYHDGPGRWDEPSDVSVADDCSPGYSCLPDPGYCRTKCNDYFDGCMEGQCRADFFRCYDDCLWEENRGRIDHPGYGEIGRPGDLFNSTEKCHNGCRSKDWGCHEDCDKKYVGHALGAVDSMDHYAHEQVNTGWECHKSCRSGLDGLKCHSDCNQPDSPSRETSKSRRSTCAWGYSCQQNGEKGPGLYPPKASQTPKHYPVPSPPGHQAGSSQQYPSPVPVPPGRLPEPPKQYTPPAPPSLQPEPSKQYPSLAPSASSAPPVPPPLQPEPPNQYSPSAPSAPSESYPEPPIQQPPALTPLPPGSLPSQDSNQAFPAPPAPPAAKPPYRCTGVPHSCHPRHGNGTMPATVVKSQATALRPLLTTVTDRLRDMRAACRLDNLKKAGTVALEMFQVVCKVVFAALAAFVFGRISAAMVGIGAAVVVEDIVGFVSRVPFFDLR